MSGEMTLFGGKGNSLVNPDLMQKLQKMNQNLMGGAGGGSVPRISIRGGRFRQIVGGEQVAVSNSNSMNIVIVNAAPVARTFYAGEYDPDKIVPPACWSPDGRAPASDVPEETRQAVRCGDCPQNIKGSGKGEGRACRFSQRVAVCIEGDYDKVFQLQLPATSIFGDVNGGHMPMGTYAKFLNAHNTPSIAVVTEMYFDDNADVPKLYFKAVRPLEEDELEACIEASESEAAQKAVEMTVAQVDGVQPARIKGPEEAPKQESKPKAESKPKPKKAPVVLDEAEDDDEPVAEPKKAPSKKAAPPVEEAEDEDEDELSAIIDEWDD